MSEDEATLIVFPDGRHERHFLTEEIRLDEEVVADDLEAGWIAKAISLAEYVESDDRVYARVVNVKRNETA